MCVCVCDDVLFVFQLAKKVDKLQQEIFQTSQDLKDAESKAEHTSNQLNILLLREKKMMKEKRDAQRQLDHAKLQIARNLRCVHMLSVVYMYSTCNNTCNRQLYTC